jgi:hypothetical protein
VLARHTHFGRELAVGFGEAEGWPSVFLKRFCVPHAASSN